eukprot:2767518-Prymnesium_polylepis.4
MSVPAIRWTACCCLRPASPARCRASISASILSHAASSAALTFGSAARINRMRLCSSRSSGKSRRSRWTRAMVRGMSSKSRELPAMLGSGHRRSRGTLGHEVRDDERSTGSRGRWPMMSPGAVSGRYARPA